MSQAIPKYNRAFLFLVIKLTGKKRRVKRYVLSTNEQRVSWE